MAPHLAHDSLSTGIIAPQEPHSPNSSSEILSKLTSQLGQDLLSSGTIAPHAPHSAIGISWFSSSDIVATYLCELIKRYNDSWT